MKLDDLSIKEVNFLSLPIWERGLKPLFPIFNTSITFVAPYMGAWIETRQSLPVRRQKIVAPYMGAWIETLSCDLFLSPPASLPIWERGLKLQHVQQPGVRRVSLPIWERGLKLAWRPLSEPYRPVAPYMGAWIETATTTSG